MSRFASPLKKQSKNDRNKKDLNYQKSFSLPPPPPPLYPDEETKSLSSSSISSKRSKSNNSTGWIHERSSIPKPVDQGKTLLLTKQLITTLQEDTVICNQPQNILFPSRVYEKSEIIRQCRHNIVCIQSDWQRSATQAIEQVQQLNLDIIKYRETSAALSQQTNEKEAELSQKKSELDKLYSHLAILEKEAAARGVKWMRPPLIRSNVATISPRHIALSVASAGANLGNSQPSDVNWKLELSELISSTTSKPQDDSSETKSDQNETSERYKRGAENVREEEERENREEEGRDSHNHQFTNQNNDYDDSSSRSSNELGHFNLKTSSQHHSQTQTHSQTHVSPIPHKPQRPAPRAPLGRPGGLVDAEIKRLSPFEFLTIDNRDIPLDQWILASVPPERGDKSSRSTTPIKWKAEKLKLSALIPPPLPPPPPPPPPLPFPHSRSTHEVHQNDDLIEPDNSSLGEEEEEEYARYSDRGSEFEENEQYGSDEMSHGDSQNLDFGRIFGLRTKTSSQQSQEKEYLEDEEIDLIELSSTSPPLKPTPKLGSSRHFKSTDRNHDEEEEERDEEEGEEEDEEEEEEGEEEEREEEEEQQHRFRYIPTTESDDDNHYSTKNPSHSQESLDQDDSYTPESDPSIREWYSGRKIKKNEKDTSSGRTHIPNFNPSERIDWKDVKYNDRDPDEEGTDDDETNIQTQSNEDPVREEQIIFEELKAAVSKNKWCRSTLSRLAMFDQISKPLQKTGTCHKFIKSCNPDEFSSQEERSKTVRLTVGWLENIANKLGTFWALPERKYLMECLLHYDEIGDRHIGWLSKLFYSFYPNRLNSVKTSSLSSPGSGSVPGCGSGSVIPQAQLPIRGNSNVPNNNIFNANGDVTTLLPSHMSSNTHVHSIRVDSSGDESSVGTSRSGSRGRRRASLTTSAPVLTRQLTHEEQNNAIAASLSSERNKFVGDLTRKERRGSMLRVENEWNSNFAYQGRGTLNRSNSTGLEASDSRWTEALHSPQFASVALPSYRTHTTTFDNALGGRGEFGVGRNWTGTTVGAKGLKHDLQQDALRTTLLLRQLSSECYQVFLLIAKYLILNCIPVERVETDLHLHYPHGYLDDREAVRNMLHLSSGSNPPAKDVLFIQQFLLKSLENTEGLIERNGKTSKKLMQWRDYILVLRSIVQSYQHKS